MQTVGYPVQYITGNVNFMGFDLKVRPGVFIPRPETELLVEKVLDILHGKRYTVNGTRTLDLCTGCGNIAISLAKSLENAAITASDISDDALAVAKENADFHRCDNIEFIKSDLFGSIDPGPFDIIASNPPYVSQSDWPELPPEVLCEPESALYGGKDGLRFYERIFEGVGPFLKEDGYLIIEIGYNQAGPVGKLLDSKGLFLQDIIKDYNGIDRIMVIRKQDG